MGFWGGGGAGLSRTGSGEKGGTRMGLVLRWRRFRLFLSSEGGSGSCRRTDWRARALDETFS